MKRSTDRILTTHTGSLPRPMDLAAMLKAVDSGEPPDRETFQTRVRASVAEVVQIQVESGVDVVSDGEQGKVGYSTYVRHRLTGFGGEGSVSVRSDWADFPAAIARQPRPSTVSRPACDGPIEWKDWKAVQRDIGASNWEKHQLRPGRVFPITDRKVVRYVPADGGTWGISQSTSLAKTIVLGEG